MIYFNKFFKGLFKDREKYKPNDNDNDFNFDSSYKYDFGYDYNFVSDFQFVPELYLRSLDHLIKNCINNNLLFFALRVDYPLSLISQQDLTDLTIKNRIVKNIFSDFELFLLSIDMLEYVFARYDIVDGMFSIKAVVTVKSIFGYDISMIDNFYSTASEASLIIKHLSKKIKIKRYISHIVKDYDDQKIFLFHNQSSPIIDQIHRDIFLYTNFIPRRFDKLDFRSIYNSEIRNIEDYIGTYNNRKIYSVKKKSVLSIFSMWNIYMLMNNIYYSIKDKKLYKKLDNGKYECYGDIEYLVNNIYKIFYFLTLRYELDGFPINQLINKYLFKAYNMLGVYSSFLIPILEEEDIKKEMRLNKNKTNINSENFIKECEEYKMEVEKEEDKRIKYSWAYGIRTRI